MLNTQADISKAKRLLQWEPQVSLYDGIKKTVEWHKTNRTWLNDLKI